MGVVGWCEGAGQTFSAGRPTNWIIEEQWPIALAVGAGAVVWTFVSFIYHISFLSLSLWETARYRLKYCLKGPLSPKQPTNKPLKVYPSI